eukprot:COSAG06_NODE_2780_length_6308_cov_20.642569_6_plen_77_part_00
MGRRSACPACTITSVRALELHGAEQLLRRKQARCAAVRPGEALASDDAREQRTRYMSEDAAASISRVSPFWSSSTG